MATCLRARVKAFSEPAVNRSEQFARLLRLPLVTPEPRYAHCGAEFPALCLLLTCDCERTLKIGFSRSATIALLNTRRMRFCVSRRASSRSSSASSPTADINVDRGRDLVQEPRSGRLRRQPAALGRRAVLRVDRAQSTAGKRLRGYHRLRMRLPLRRIHHAARASNRSYFMTFETDSKRRAVHDLSADYTPSDIAVAAG